MTEGAGAFFEQIRALAARPVEPPSPDPFLQSVLATEQIDRCAQMEELLARARALGVQAPTDVVELLEIAAAGKREAIEVRAAAEDRIARAAAGSKYIVDGIERLAGYSNQSWWKANPDIHRVPELGAAVESNFTGSTSAFGASHDRLRGGVGD